jgi:AraC-like DNA-binding protein
MARMSLIEFTALPLPHYIRAGYSVAGPGRKHPERYAIGEFDLLVVAQGCLYIGEEDRQYEVGEGCALILRPDLHHYPTAGCREKTISYWLHFHTAGSWRMADDDGEEAGSRSDDRPAPGRTFRMQTFRIRVPQFSRLAQPAKMYELMRQLVALERDSHLHWVRWEQQLLFQQVLMTLAAGARARSPRPGAVVADQAASYLRKHYREKLTAKELGEALNFHPVYIARCMKRQFGCSPTEYLLHYRLDQAKLLLLQTDLPVGQIAREVGFRQPAYFTACFVKHEGVTPREYRRRFLQHPGAPEFESDPARPTATGG